MSAEDNLATMSVPEHAIQEMGQSHWNVLFKHIIASDGFIEVWQNPMRMTRDFLFDRPQNGVMLPFSQPNEDKQT